MAVLAATVFTACSVTKSVPKGDYLYTGARFKYPNGKIDKDVRGDLEKIPRPKPNSSILGVPYKLIWFNAMPEPKKQRGLLYKMKYKWGEAPVLLSSVNPYATKPKLNNYLFDYGYFRPDLQYRVVQDSGKRKAYVEHTISPGTRYVIRDIHYPTDTGQVFTQMQESLPASLVKKGDYVSLQNLEKERERIDEWLRNRGYFFFNPDFILFRIDTLHGGQADVYYTLKEETTDRALETWRIGDISIYSNYSMARDSVLKTRVGKKEKRFTVIDSKERYKASVYESAILLKEDQLYRKSTHFLSIERLMNLNNFRFVKMQFNPDTLQGNRRLDTKVYLTPMKKNSLHLETSVSGKTGNYLGSEISVKLRNVNLMKGAEIFDIKLSAGFDAQLGGKKTESPNAYSLIADASLYMPRIVPYFKVITGQNSFIPRTAISLGAEFLQRPEYYTQRTFRLGLEYIWKYKKTTEHNLKLIRIQSIDPSNTTPKFDSMLAEDVSLRASFEKQLIIGSQYNFNYSNTFRLERRFTHAIRLTAGTSGNLAGLLSNPAVDTPGAKKLFNIPIAQFVKLEADLRGYWKLSHSLTWANRFIAGTAIAYGNSKAIPYAEQFFIGGSNSIRAFRIRTLGPGTFHSDESVFRANESGDIKLEANTEMRYSVGKFFRFAGFVDAGNIWLRKESPDKPGAAAKRGEYLNEFAVGAGIGLRVDVSIMVLRLDIATPLRKPWYPEGDRWVFDEIDLGNRNWRKDNLIYSIAIGYPF